MIVCSENQTIFRMSIQSIIIIRIMITLLIWSFIATEVCGGLIKRFPSIPLVFPIIGGRGGVFSSSTSSTPSMMGSSNIDNGINDRIYVKDDDILLPTSDRGYYNAYYAVADQNEALKVVSQVSQVDLNKISRVLKIKEINDDTLYFVKTTRHRNKRYTSYLTLCPFKICNMGRKRTRTKIYTEDK